MQIAAPIRIAVVGAGHWGPNLIRNFDNPPRQRGARGVRSRSRPPGSGGRAVPHIPVTDRFDLGARATPTSTRS